MVFVCLVAVARVEVDFLAVQFFVDELCFALVLFFAEQQDFLPPQALVLALDEVVFLSIANLLLYFLLVLESFADFIRV